MGDTHREVETGYLEVTRLLHEWGGGRSGALEELVPMVYKELHQQAKRCFHERGENLLQATALVSEVYLRLAGSKQIEFQDREHFFCIAGRMMRRILVEQARKRLTAKRGGNLTVTLDERIDAPAMEMDLPMIISLETALDKLEKDYPRQARILEWKVFAGMGNREIANVLEISLATVKREWAQAKQRIFLILERSSAGGP